MKHLQALVLVMVLPELSAQAPRATWPGWGGPNGDFRVASPIELTESWSKATGPRHLWKRALGDGFAGIVCLGDRLFTTFRDDTEEVVIAINRRDGSTIWETRYPHEPYEDQDKNYGLGPNATPRITGRYLVAVSNRGEVRSLDLASGQVRWHVDLHEKFGRQKKKEEYGYSTSPLLYDGSILVLVGGTRHGVVALDPDDGKLRWGSEPCRVSYAPPTLMRLAGRDQLVFFGPQQVLGLDPRSGKFLWRFPVRCRTENNLTPALSLGSDHVWVASQLDGRTRVLKIELKAGKFRPHEVWTRRRLTQGHWNSFRIGDHVIGSIGGNYGSKLTAVEWRTGKVAWRHAGFHCVKGVLADRKLYFLDENGNLGIARLKPDGVEILDSHQVLERVSWTPPTLFEGTLYVRDRKNIVAIDLRKSSYE